MTIQEQIQMLLNKATTYRSYAREATEEAQQIHWTKLAQAKMESAELLQEEYQTYLEEDAG